MSLVLLHTLPPEIYSAYFKDPSSPGKGAPLAKAPGAVVCAEDPFWDTNPVPRLSRLCIRSLARFFSRKPRAWLALGPRDRAAYFQALDTGENLALTADLVEDEAYWRRCCQEHLKVGRVSICYHVDFKP